MMYTPDSINVFKGNHHLCMKLFLLFTKVVQWVIKCSNVLLFADNAKLFLKINLIYDYIIILEDLNTLNNLYYLNSLVLI